MKPKLILYLIFLFLIQINVKGQDTKPLIIKLNGKYGYINSVGELIIPSIYEEAYEFNNGVALVKTKSHWGIINQKGKLITKNKYDNFITDDDGITVFQINDTLVYVNNKGEEIFKETGEYSNRIWNEGYHAIKSLNKWGIIDTTGKIIIPTIYDNIGDVHEGLIYVSILADGDFYEYKNSEGKIFKTKNYDTLSKLESCYYPEPLNDKGWIINLKNEKLFKLPPNYHFFGYHGEWAAFKQANELETLINKKGQLFDKEFYGVEEFKDSIARVAIKIESNNFNVIEITDTIIDNCTGNEIYLEDLNKDRKLNYINYNGNLLNNELYDGAFLFFGDYAVVQKGKKFGTINKKGGNIIPIIYDNLMPLNNIYKYKLNDSWGLISSKGELITKPVFDDISFNGEHLAFQKNKKWGIINTKGEILLKPQFEYIIYINNKEKYIGYLEGVKPANAQTWYWQVESEFFSPDSNVKLGYMTLNGKIIWKPTK